MSQPISSLPLQIDEEVVPSLLKRKRVLLVDRSASTRELRTGSMQKLGIDVDCAADISEARSWWRADVYSLVLFDMESGPGDRDKFCDELRGAIPRQQLAFFVGKPGYLSNTPNPDEATLASVNNGDPSLFSGLRTALAEASKEAQHWGIMEASRRISAVRSQSHERSRARFEQPDPPRDIEVREFRRSSAWSKMMPELTKSDAR